MFESAKGQLSQELDAIRDAGDELQQWAERFGFSEALCKRARRCAK